MPHCHIALGGNVGRVEETFQTALARLATDNLVAIARVSSVWRTRPIGPRSGGEFLNAAAEIETSLEPLDLLDVLKDVERRAGRTPSEHWAPRPLDLDLIFYANRVIAHPRLVVPHPACWYRRFVLDPLDEIAAEVRHPVKGISVRELRARLLHRPLRLALAGSIASERERLRRDLSPTSAEFEVIDWRPPYNSGAEPAILAWLGPDRDADAPTDFRALPLVPRLDVSAADDPTAYLHGVLQAALG
jgi:2-amino-4-hydroxy-6-hydroxymethyldihydropteridine diphosphokinase